MKVIELTKLLDNDNFDMSEYLKYREQEMSKQRGKKSNKQIREEKQLEKQEEDKEDKEDKERLYFSFDDKDQHKFLSCYYDSPFTVRGKLYKTVQHYYQSQKFIQEDMKSIREEIENANTPFEAKKISKRSVRKVKDASYWKEWRDERRMDVMRRGIKEKFGQHSDLKKKLIETEDKELIENETFNAFWYSLALYIGMVKKKDP